jgi:hypothetical protein
LNSAVSLGVVDDTCGVDVTVTLALPQTFKAPLVARANIFVGPPDFGPDRRPFLSLADELADRCSDAAERNAALSQKDVSTKRSRCSISITSSGSGASCCEGLGSAQSQFSTMA